MAVSIIGTTMAANVFGPTVTIPVPAGLEAGDVLVAVQRSQSGTSTSYPGNPAFTRLGPYIAAQQAGRTSGMWAHVVTNPATEPGTYTFTILPEEAVRGVGVLVAIRGLDTANLVADVVDSYAGSQNGAIVTTESLTADTPCLQVLFYGQEVTAGISHVPASLPPGFTETTNVQTGSGTSGSRTALWVGHREVGVGETGTSSITWNYSSGSPGGQSVLLRIGEDTPPPPPGIPVQLAGNHSGRIVGISSGQTISGIRTLRPGFDSVDQMLSTPGATWAHRGGSLNWPEMSEYAYDRAALEGYGALEFSAQRTSDGWWMGSHDPDLNRVVMTSGLPNISTMTRAQVEALSINLNAAGRPRPFFGLVDFLDKWTPTHVVICDLKNAAAFQTEFFNLLDAHGGPTKIVAKSYGSSSGFANAASARGYESWGYFYQDNFDNGDLAAWQGPWSILGMDIDASTAWTGVLSYGKPVVGHIASTQAKYDLAISKGANMVQCSNVAGIAPVSRGG